MKDATSRVSPKEEVPKAGKEGPSTIFLLVEYWIHWDVLIEEKVPLGWNGLEQRWTDEWIKRIHTADTPTNLWLKHSWLTDWWQEVLIFKSNPYLRPFYWLQFQASCGWVRYPQFLPDYNHLCYCCFQTLKTIFILCLIFVWMQNCWVVVSSWIINMQLLAASCLDHGRSRRLISMVRLFCWSLISEVESYFLWQGCTLWSSLI